MTFKPTIYPEINHLLSDFSQELSSILSGQLIGLYLFGSLTYGNFNPDNSDIDLVAILDQPATTTQLDKIKQLHKAIADKYPTWSKRLECSYTPRALFKESTPPKTPRPYFGNATFYPQAPYGNEWLINNYLLYHHGITLKGPNFKTLIQPIPIKAVQRACLQDLRTEWQPKLKDEEYLDNPHYQSYLVLNLCRILYTLKTGALTSKPVSAAWVKTQFPQWTTLVNAALNWKYGQPMPHQQQTKSFLHFILTHTSPKSCQIRPIIRPSSQV